MRNVATPKTPRVVYLQATSELTAYKAGALLRIIWEVTKNLAKWAALIAAAIAIGGIYFLWQLLFGTMKR